MLLDRYETLQGPSYSELLASHIDGVDSIRAHELMKQLESSGLAMHGIKRLGLIDGVDIGGVEPRTPESGPASFWGLGEGIFGRLSPDGSTLSTFDTPFFHYAHAYSFEEPQRRVMAAAVTTADRLADRRGEMGYRGYQATLPVVLPRDEFCLVVCEGPNSQIDMFEALEILSESDEQGSRLLMGGTITRQSA